MRETHTQARKPVSGLQRAPLMAKSVTGPLATSARVRQIVAGPQVQTKPKVTTPSEQETALDGRVHAEASASTPDKLRIADVQYDPQGQPLPEKLTPADKARLGSLVEKLKKDDPKFYAEIENEDLVVTQGKLSANNFGMTITKPQLTTYTLSAKVWFLIDQSGADLSQGKIDYTSDAWNKAGKLFEETFPDTTKQNALGEAKETRVIRSTLSYVIILDLQQIDAAYRQAAEEFDKYKSSSQFNLPNIDAPKLPQSALLVLRHEAGHLVFSRTFAYDKLGNLLPSKTLPEWLKNQVRQNTGHQDIDTEMKYLSEGAAKGVEASSGPFDLASFKEENDPRFGIGGYHDLEGKEQAPSGFTMRMAKELPLTGAKQTARDIRAIVDVPIFLLTIPKPTTAHRRFDVLILMAAEKNTIRDRFDQLQKEFPALGKYKNNVVAF